MSKIDLTRRARRIALWQIARAALLELEADGQQHAVEIRKRIDAEGANEIGALQDRVNAITGAIFEVTS